LATLSAARRPWLAAGRNCRCRDRRPDHPWRVRFWRNLLQVRKYPKSLCSADRWSAPYAAMRGLLLIPVNRPRPRVLVLQGKNQGPAACREQLEEVAEVGRKKDAGSFQQPR